MKKYDEWNIVQGKLFSSKRLLNKIGTISQNDFKQLKIKLKELINV